MNEFRVLLAKCIVSVLVCLAVSVWCPRLSLAQEISQDQAYSAVSQALQRCESGMATAADAVSSVGLLSGLWSSSAYPGLELRLVDKGGALFGLAKVPNALSGGDLYHVSGGYTGSTVILHHFSQNNYKVFVGSLSGSTVTGTLTVYDYTYTPLQTLSGVTFTKQTASGSALSQSSLAGNWHAGVLAKSIQGTMAMTKYAGIGEQVGHLEGSLTVPASGGSVPYHFIGYYLNNGEVFLVNTSGSGAVFRTLLGTAQGNGSSVVAQLEQGTDYFVGSPVLSFKILCNVASIWLLNNH